MILHFPNWSFKTFIFGYRALLSGRFSIAFLFFNFAHILGRDVMGSEAGLFLLFALIPSLLFSLIGYLRFLRCFFRPTL